MSEVRLGHFLLSLGGLGLARHLLDPDRTQFESTLETVCRTVEGLGEPPLCLGAEIPERNLFAGYAEWASTYDSFPNPLIDVEEEELSEILDGIPPGRALDVACGTGRLAQRLRELGHNCVGIDQSAEMLGIARPKLPGVPLALGQLEDIPLRSRTVDLVVCCLALSHLADIGPALLELARVTRPGGRILISDFHPIMILMGGQALYRRRDGSSAFVQSHAHLYSECLDAFSAAGLTVIGCRERTWGESAWKSGVAALAPDLARVAWEGLPAAIVWTLVSA